jgi:hypothetical protein
MRQSTASNLAIQVRLQSDLASAIEGFRRRQPVIPTRPEAIRRLIRRGLEVGSDLDVLTSKVAGHADAGVRQR